MSPATQVTAQDLEAADPTRNPAVAREIARFRKRNPEATVSRALESLRDSGLKERRALGLASLDELRKALEGASLAPPAAARVENSLETIRREMVEIECEDHRVSQDEPVRFTRRHVPGAKLTQAEQLELLINREVKRAEGQRKALEQEERVKGEQLAALRAFEKGDPAHRAAVDLYVSLRTGDPANAEAAQSVLTAIIRLVIGNAPELSLSRLQLTIAASRGLECEQTGHKDGSFTFRWLPRRKKA